MLTIYIVMAILGLSLLLLYLLTKPLGNSRLDAGEYYDNVLKVINRLILFFAIIVVSLFMATILYIIVLSFET